MTDQEAEVTSLLRIDSLPLDLSGGIFMHYPAMKLGVASAVDFYVEKLADEARHLINRSPACREWVLTAPPSHVLPAAANLLCRKVYDALQADDLFPDRRFRCLELKLPKQSLQIRDSKDFERYYRYSSNTVEDRIRERARLQQDKDDIIEHAKDLRGRGVIVINDIRVTGTQQRFMQSSFDRVRPRQLHWLYILDVAKEIGVANPEVEHAINHSSIKSLEEFKDVLALDQIEYTARCISRLFSLEIDDFESLLANLEPERRRLILDLARREGRYDGEYFREKMHLWEFRGQRTEDRRQRIEDRGQKTTA